MTPEVFTIAGARPIPATFTPASDAEPVGSASPVVLLLHGTASTRDEVGALFVQLASALQRRGIASLRIDFAGCGDSTSPQTDFTVTSQLEDARSALGWLLQDARVDPARIGLLGFSQGGMIATLLAADSPDIAALAIWSSGIVTGGAFASFAPYFEGGDPTDPVTIDLGFTSFTFSRQWWREAGELDLASAIGRYGHPLLALAGSDDDVVPPQASLDLIARAASRDVTFRMLAGGDHIFRALDADPAPARAAVHLTAEWFEALLPARQRP